MLMLHAECGGNGCKGCKRGYITAKFDNQHIYVSKCKKCKRNSGRRIFSNTPLKPKKCNQCKGDMIWEKA